MSETYEEILTKMQEKFKAEAGFSADDASDIGIRLKVLAGEIYSACTNVDWLKQQVFPQTASGEYLDYHAQERGIERKKALHATGVLTFSRDTALDHDVVINKGVICSTASSDGVKIITDEQVTLAKDSLSVDVKATAELGGIIGNVAADTVTVFVSPPSGIIHVTNKEAFSGGYEAESDQELRERIIDSYKNIANGTNTAFYKAKALEYEDVYSASAVARAQGNGSVDVYVAGHSAVCSEELMQQIESELNELREINVNVSVKSPELVKSNVIAYITVEHGYIASEVIEECKQAIRAYFDTLRIGQNVLLADIGEVIYHIDGIANYNFDRVLCGDMKLNDTQLGVINNFQISEAS